VKAARNFFGPGKNKPEGEKNRPGGAKLTLPNFPKRFKSTKTLTAQNSEKNPSPPGTPRSPRPTGGGLKYVPLPRSRPPLGEKPGLEKFCGPHLFFRFGRVVCVNSKCPPRGCLLVQTAGPPFCPRFSKQPPAGQSFLGPRMFLHGPRAGPPPGQPLFAPQVRVLNV